MHSVGKLHESDRRFRLPELCGTAERRSMPVLPLPLVELSFHPSKRPFADLEGPLPPVKRQKFGGCAAFGTVGSGPLAISIFNYRSTGSCDKPSADSEIDSPRKIRGNSTGEDLNCNVHDSTIGDGGTESASWKLRVVASSRCKNPSLLSSDVIGSIDFNEDGNFFATGGIARKIRVCSYSRIVSESDGAQDTLNDGGESLDDEEEGFDIVARRRRRSRDLRTRRQEIAAVGEICTPGKLSSLKWRPDGSEVIGCGDYDGVVSEWSIEHGHTVSERYEHSGQRVWGLDYSKLLPTMSASSSADGTVRVWSRGVEKSIGVLRPASGNSVCCAEFNPEVQHLIAIASADTCVYLYDLRNQELPLLKLSGHNRAVSYVRFLSKDSLVSASIDSTMNLWDISMLSTREDEFVDEQNIGRGNLYDGGAQLLHRFSSHTNVRHFVGLSVHRGAGILACGSETDEVFVYSRASTTPLLQHSFPSRCTDYVNNSGSYQGPSYVGAVCWREQGDNFSLVAANSDGVVQLLQATSPPRTNYIGS